MRGAYSRPDAVTWAHSYLGSVIWLSQRSQQAPRRTCGGAEANASCAAVACDAEIKIHFVQRTYGPFLVKGANSWLCIREIDQKLDVTPGVTLDADGKARFD